MGFFGEPSFAEQMAEYFKTNPETVNGQVFNADRYKDNPFDINSSNAAERQRAQQYRQHVDQSLVEGKPVQKEFQSALDENGKLKDVYQLNPNTIGAPNINQGGIEAVRARALGTGPSPWLNLKMQEQGGNEARALDTANSTNAGNAAAARSNLAMHGGLSSGASERLAKSEMQGGNAGAQGVRSAGTQERLGLNIADESSRMGLLNALPGMELANAQPGIDVAKFNAGATSDTQKYNSGAALNDLFQKRAYDTANYSEAMRAWAAGKSADAQANSGKK